MKKFKNLVIGGIENKVFNLVFITVLLIVLAFGLVIRHQSKELSELVQKTGREQQESMESISQTTMQGVMDATMNRTASLQAELADTMFSEVRSDISMLADYATKLYNDPQAYPEMILRQPGDFSEDKNMLAMLYAEETDTSSEDVREEAALIGNLGDMMLSLLNNSKYLGACYIATASGATLMCDASSTIQKCAEADFLFDARKRPWYAGAMQSDGVYFSGIERDYYTSRIGIVCSMPVYQNGRPVAVVGGDLFLDEMEAAVRNSATESGFCFIADDDGRVVFSPKTDGILKVAPTEEAADLRSAEYGALAEVLKQSLTGESGIRKVECDGQAFYMSGAPIRTVGWTVIVAANQEAVEQPTAQMLSQHQEIREQATEEYRKGIARAGRFLVIVLLLLFLAAMVNAMVLAGRIVRPLNRMTKRIAVLTGEDPVFEMSEEYKSGDEVEVLAQSFADLSKRTREYIAENTRITAEKERIGAELNVANRIQADMLPRIFPPFPDRKEFDLYATMDPAKEVGGDFYDFFLIDEDHLAMVMADVSGKGVPAALFMVIAKTLIKNRAQMGGTPGEILSDVNNRLCENNESNLFVTVWLAILQISTGTGMAANAGHEHPVLRHAGEEFALVEYKHSPPLGLIEGLACKEHAFTLQPGDTLFVYTDGVTEAAQKVKNLFGTERMLAALNERPDAALEEVLENMTRRITEFVGDGDQFDDITMLCLKYHGIKR